MSGILIKRTVAEIIILVLKLTSINGGKHSTRCRHKILAAEIAPIVARELPNDYEVAIAIMLVESSFDQYAVSPAGSVGLMQIYPLGVASFLCKHLDYTNDIDSHIACGAKIIKYYKRTCGDDPSIWLSAYYGIGCKVTKYSKKVLQVLQ